MQKVQIQITGSGTSNQVYIRLLEIAREIELSGRENEIPEFGDKYEDGILSVKIEDQNNYPY